MFPPFTRPHGWTIEGLHLMTGPPSSNGHYSSINAHELAWGVALSVRAGCESVGVEVAARCCAVMVAIRSAERSWVSTAKEGNYDGHQERQPNTHAPSVWGPHWDGDLGDRRCKSTRSRCAERSWHHSVNACRSELGNGSPSRPTLLSPTLIHPSYKQAKNQT